MCGKSSMAQGGRRAAARRAEAGRKARLSFRSPASSRRKQVSMRGLSRQPWHRLRSVPIVPHRARRAAVIMQPFVAATGGNLKARCAQSTRSQISAGWSPRRANRAPRLFRFCARSGRRKHPPRPSPSRRACRGGTRRRVSMAAMGSPVHSAITSMADARSPQRIGESRALVHRLAGERATKCAFPARRADPPPYRVLCRQRQQCAPRNALGLREEHVRKLAATETPTRTGLRQQRAPEGDEIRRSSWIRA